MNTNLQVYTYIRKGLCNILDEGKLEIKRTIHICLASLLDAIKCRYAIPSKCVSKSRLSVEKSTIFSLKRAAITGAIKNVLFRISYKDKRAE